MQLLDTHNIHHNSGMTCTIILMRHMRFSHLMGFTTNVQNQNITEQLRLEGTS